MRDRGRAAADWRRRRSARSTIAGASALSMDARRDSAGVAGGVGGGDHRGALRDAGVAGRPPGDAQGRCSSAGGRGLEPTGGAPLSVVNLATDTTRLLAPGALLSRRQATLLRQVKLLARAVPHRISVTVVNPLQLLRELFTVNGAGTLIRRGSRIDVHTTAGGRRSRAAARRCSIGVRARRCAPEFFAQPHRADLRRGGLPGRGGGRRTPGGART